ncbi:MAG TPA: sigma-54 dependent transcriptional regulator [Gemmatimonadales bacterium]|jgi:DNA-binding NtrC family response regulator|nr:sigma-54 dependent transcriptional regulator [Gemmatimonadales bacterium]
MADTILLIDDDVTVLRIIGAYFEQHGWDVLRELTGEAGLVTFDRNLPDVVIVDLNLPGMDGLEVLERLRGRETAVIVLTGEGDVPTAVRAIQSGAENFIMKPVDLAHLLAAAGRAVEKVRLRRVNRTLIGQSSAGDGVESLGSSPLMRELGRQLTQLALSDRATILLQGEAGTGKRWIARLIHDISPRSAAPFIELACGTGDPTWLELELLGRDGSAGGDIPADRRQGLLEVADRGTLFLDEVADLPLELQAKLLSVLETRALRRAGGSREVPIDVRVIATTARSLPAAVDAGRFREDLFSLLNVMPLTVPAVRERGRDDLLALIRRFLKELASAAPGSPNRLSDDALDRMLRHSWPGNVRELRNVIERALMLARGHQQVGVEHLPPEVRAKSGVLDRRHTPLTLDELERMHIDRTLKHHAGNRTRTAQELGISRATLIAKIKKYAITS